jgi:hypothetical protein
MIRQNPNPSLIKAVKAMGNPTGANRRSIQNMEKQATLAREAKEVNHLPREPKDTNSCERQCNLCSFSFSVQRRTPVVVDS